MGLSGSSFTQEEAEAIADHVYGWLKERLYDFSGGRGQLGDRQAAASRLRIQVAQIITEGGIVELEAELRRQQSHVGPFGLAVFATHNSLLVDAHNILIYGNIIHSLVGVSEAFVTELLRSAPASRNGIFRFGQATSGHTYEDAAANAVDVYCYVRPCDPEADTGFADVYFIQAISDMGTPGFIAGMRTRLPQAA